MKTFKLISTAIVLSGILAVGCSKDYMRIEGTGPIITQTLPIEEFSKISIEGVDNVVVTYGPVQEVTVRGHINILSRIKKNVINDTWFIELESGNYGHYELTYYLTLPSLHKVANTGTGDVVVKEFPDQEYLSVNLTGTGSFYGFPMRVNRCDINISGTGDCEVSVAESLDVNIEGSGHVYYKGTPTISGRITGSGSVIPSYN